ncbi:alpha-L-fucosidase [Bacteroidota bacterium]
MITLLQRLLKFLIRFFGSLTLVLIVVITIGSLIIFDSDMNYYPVKDPNVHEKLESWQDRKFGLFMHWGPYSQWGVVESWRNDEIYTRYKQDYENLKYTFNPVNFNPDKWVEAAKDAGMGYLVFTTKHHDGFCMFDTQTTDYKITNDSVPFSSDPRADVTREIFNTFRENDFMIGAYFSKADWNSEYFWWPNFATPNRNVNYDIQRYPERWEKFIDFTHTQVDELVSNYGQVDILWFDGGWVRPHTMLESKVSSFFSNLYLKAGYTQLNPPQSMNLKMAELAEKARVKQPGLIMVDRAVEGSLQDYLTPEQHIPEEFIPHPWESCITMGGSWSYNPNEKYKPAKELIHILVDIVSKGGNLLLNIGPGPDGEWHEEAYIRLSEIGDWMDINSSAIYNTKGSQKFAEGNFRFTWNSEHDVNAILLAEDTQYRIPEELVIESVKPGKDTKVKLLGYGQELAWEKYSGGIKIQVPAIVASNPPCKYAWVFEIKNIK